MPTVGNAIATTSNQRDSCAHVLTMQKVLGQMLSEEAQSSFFGDSHTEPLLVEAAPA